MVWPYGPDGSPYTVMGCPMSEHDTTIPTVQDMAVEWVRQRMDGGYSDVDDKVLPDKEVLAVDGEGWHVVEVFAGKKYRKVADHTVPVSATLPQDFQIVRRRPADLFDDLCPLPGFPPVYEPGLRYTQERHDEYLLDSAGFLWPEELKLAEWVMLQNKKAFAWTKEEQGFFRFDLFDPVKIPMMPHTLSVLKNIPILHSIHLKVCKIIQMKIAAGTYEPSNSSYCCAGSASPRKMICPSGWCMTCDPSTKSRYGTSRRCRSLTRLLSRPPARCVTPDSICS